MMVCPYIYQEIQGSIQPYIKLFELFTEIREEERYLALSTIFTDTRHPIFWPYPMRVAWMLSQIHTVVYTPRLHSYVDFVNEDLRRDALTRVVEAPRWLEDSLEGLGAGSTVLPNASRLAIDVSSFTLSNEDLIIDLQRGSDDADSDGRMPSDLDYITDEAVLAHFDRLGKKWPNRNDLSGAVKYMTSLFEDIRELLPIRYICVNVGSYESSMYDISRSLGGSRNLIIHVSTTSSRWAYDLQLNTDGLTITVLDQSKATRARANALTVIAKRSRKYRQIWVVHPKGSSDELSTYMDETIAAINRRRKDYDNDTKVEWGYLPTEADGSTKCPCCGSM